MASNRFTRGRNVDPDVFFRSSSDSRVKRKEQQLCAEVQRALTLALVCDSRDPVIQDLIIEEVTAPAGSRRLVVTVRAMELSGVSYAELVERVVGFKATARASVAARIHRQRAPELEFVVLVGDGGAS